jgi:hypothetical protein
VVKSLKILSHNHTYQYTQMVNAPAGGRRSPVSPPGKVIWLGGSGMQRSLMTKKVIGPQPCEGGLKLLSGEKQKLPAAARSFQVCARRLCVGNSS